MATRTTIYNAFVSTLETVSGVASVTRQAKTLDEISDWPTITLSHTPREAWTHLGDGDTLRSIQTQLRAYVRTYEEDSLGDSDSLAQLIETAVTDFESQPLVIRSQVLEVSTDEGLFTPYGIVDMQIEILYEETT